MTAMIIQGRYKIVQPVGHGGMGTVYEAIDLRQGTRVALKRQNLPQAESQPAFEREARLLAGLRDPALPQVFDYGMDSQGHFLVLEFIDGPDLAALLRQRRRPFGMAQVLEWADQILLALAYLHGQVPPVIHRDIKPHNLKLTPQNQIMLLDFDLAGRVGNKPVSPGGAQGYTEEYAPLEQIQGGATDGRSDLYALAATLYHLLAGTPPAPALGRESARQAGMPDPLLPIHHLNPALPPVLSTILGKALAQEPGQRFAAADSMQLALGKIPAAAQALATLGDTIVLDDGPKNTATPAALGETIVLNRPAAAPPPGAGGSTSPAQPGLPRQPAVPRPQAQTGWWGYIQRKVATNKGVLFRRMIVALVWIGIIACMLMYGSVFVTTDAQVMIPATVDWMKGWQRSRDAALAFKDACMAGDTATAASYVAENINEKVESICAQMRATSMTSSDLFLGNHITTVGKDGPIYRWPLLWWSEAGSLSGVFLSLHEIDGIFIIVDFSLTS